MTSTLYNCTRVLGEKSKWFYVNIVCLFILRGVVSYTMEYDMCSLACVLYPYIAIDMISNSGFCIISALSATGTGSRNKR